MEIFSHSPRGLLDLAPVNLVRGQAVMAAGVRLDNAGIDCKALGLNQSS